MEAREQSQGKPSGKRPLGKGDRDCGDKFVFVAEDDSSNGWTETVRCFRETVEENRVKQRHGKRHGVIRTREEG